MMGIWFQGISLVNISQFSIFKLIIDLFTLIPGIDPLFANSMAARRGMYFIWITDGYPDLTVSHAQFNLLSKNLSDRFFTP